MNLSLCSSFENLLAGFFFHREMLNSEKFAWENIDSFFWMFSHANLSEFTMSLCKKNPLVK